MVSGSIEEAEKGMQYDEEQCNARCLLWNCFTLLLCSGGKYSVASSFGQRKEDQVVRVVYYGNWECIESLSPHFVRRVEFLTVKRFGLGSYNQ
jgi:hypothetical protein